MDTLDLKQSVLTSFTTSSVDSLQMVLPLLVPLERPTVVRKPGMSFTPLITLENNVRSKKTGVYIIYIYISAEIAFGLSLRSRQRPSVPPPPAHAQWNEDCNAGATPPPDRRNYMHDVSLSMLSSSLSDTVTRLTPCRSQT